MALIACFVHLLARVNGPMIVVRMVGNIFLHCLDKLISLSFCCIALARCILESASAMEVAYASGWKLL